jgi:hypothetical protein
LDAVSQYFYDSNTGFYYDPKTGFYFNSTTQQWCFWCSKFSTYIPVEGPEIELRKKLQIEERALYNQDESTTTAEPAATTSQTEAPELVNQQESEKPKKKKKKEDNGKVNNLMSYHQLMAIFFSQRQHSISKRRWISGQSDGMMRRSR